MKKNLILLLALLITSVGFSQTNVTGRVTEAESGVPALITVSVKGSSVGVYTDSNGGYSITIPGGATDAVLVFSGIGYITQEVSVNARSVVNISIASSALALDEVVITGYAPTTKKAFTGSAASVTSEKITNKFEPNPIKALQGSIPGLQMNTASGQPGAPSTVYVRGRSSLNSGTQPLYVIDGLPFETGTQGRRSNEGQEISPLATINSSDIESITVLKDATATSIYGSRAANGVIVITTKRGKSGELSINFSAKAGVEMLPNIPKGYLRTNASQYWELWEESLLNAHQYAQGLSKTSYFDYYNNGYNLGLPYTKEGARDFMRWYTEVDLADQGVDVNWLDEVTRNGVIQNYTIDLKGGGADKRSARYFISFDYMDNKGIVIGKDMTRYSMRLNYDQSPSKIVNIGLNTNLSYSEINMGAGGGYFSDPITQAFMQSPVTPVRKDNGEWNFGTVNGYNPVAQRSELGDKSTAKQYRAIVSPYVQINFTDYLYFMSRAGVDAYLLDEFGYWSFLQPQGNDMRGMGENSYTANMSLTSTNTLNFSKLFGRNTLNLLVGHEGQRTDLKSTYLSGSNYAVDYLNDVILASVPGSASTQRSELLQLSFLSRAEYSYDNKYYLSASFRYDASSRFGANNRWAPFWSVGGRYRISNEAFMADTRDWLTDLTVRTSYGTSGNQQVGPGWYAAKDLYFLSGQYNGLSGSGRSQFGNPDLKWEQTGKLNFGVDFSLFNNINFAADYYINRTTDMVFAVPVSMTTGLSSYYKNMGELKNAGFEISVSANVINKPDLTWNIELIGSRNVNEVVALSSDKPIEGVYQITEVGREIGYFKMKEWAGVDPATGLGLWYLNETGEETTLNYNAAAKRYVGGPSPDFQGGFNTTLRWKDFDFTLQMNYSIGGKIYGNNLRYDEQTGLNFGENFAMYSYENRWREPGDNAKSPMLASMSGRFETQHSSRFLMDASYLKIRAINLGYTLPAEVTSKFGVKSMRFSVNANNVHTFSAKDYRGFDPSGIAPNGVQWWNYPIPRNVMMGLNIGF